MFTASWSSDVYWRVSGIKISRTKVKPLIFLVVYSVTSGFIFGFQFDWQSFCCGQNLAIRQKKQAVCQLNGYGKFWQTNWPNNSWFPKNMVCFNVVEKYGFPTVIPSKEKNPDGAH